MQRMEIKDQLGLKCILLDPISLS